MFTLRFLSLPLLSLPLLSLIGCSSDARWIIRTDVVEPGEDCAGGGLSIVGGTDVNGDDVLGDDEVETQEFVCDGAKGTSTLVQTAEEAAGDNCADGGTRVDSGADDNGDGQLGADEIDVTTYVCNGETPFTDVIWYGNATIEDATDAATLAPYTVVTGSLEITSDEDVSFPNLRIVGSTLYGYDYAGGANGTTSVSLPVLETVNATYAYYVAFSAPSLTAIHTDAVVEGGAANVDYLHNITRLSSLTLYNGDIADGSGLENLSNADSMYVYNMAIPSLPSLTDVGALQLNDTTNTNMGALAAVENIGSTYIYGTQLNNLTALTDVTLEPGSYVEIVNNSALCQTSVNAFFTDIGATSYYSYGNAGC